MELSLVSDNLLGDTLLQTPALRTWQICNQEGELTYYCGTSRGSHELLRHNHFIKKLVEFDGPLDVPASIKMDAAVAFNLGAANGKSLAWGYGQMIGVEIDSLKYDYWVTETEEWDAKCQADIIGQGKPIVLVARHSASCSSNDPKVRIPNKCVANRIWVQVARWLMKEGFVPLAIGSAKEASDSRYLEWPGEKLYGAPLREIAALSRVVAGTLSVDTGIRHLAAAAGGNMYCISGAIPLSLIQCVPVRDEQKVYEEHVPLRYVAASTIIEGAKKIL